MSVNEKTNNSIFHAKGEVAYKQRCAILKQRGIVLWFTGLSGSGKTTVASLVEKKLSEMGRLSYRLDGDNLRMGLNSDLGFSMEDRNENIRRVAEVASLFRDTGVITLVSFISPLRSMRELAKSIIGQEHYIEIWTKSDIETCISRDPKGLYKSAINGAIQDFTGLASPYEEPVAPDLILNTNQTAPEDCSLQVLDFLSGYIN